MAHLGDQAIHLQQHLVREITEVAVIMPVAFRPMEAVAAVLGPQVQRLIQAPVVVPEQVESELTVRLQVL